MVLRTCVTFVEKDSQTISAFAAPGALTTRGARVRVRLPEGARAHSEESGSEVNFA